MRILIFGNGYVTKHLTKKLASLDWEIFITSRTPNSSSAEGNIQIINFLDAKINELIASSDIILSTAPPSLDEKLEPILFQYSSAISKCKASWVGYLSSTSVYGNHDGNWVNENTYCSPSSVKAKSRLQAENKWLELFTSFQIPVHILRLSGIYGPNRNSINDIKNGKDFTVIKEGQFFSRIHVEDICNVILASISKPTPGEVYNISDNEPSPPQDVQKFAASLVGKTLEEIPFEKAEMSSKAKLFYKDNKKVDNTKIKKKLGFKFTYPTYKEGLKHEYQ